MAVRAGKRTPSWQLHRQQLRMPRGLFFSYGQPVAAECQSPAHFIDLPTGFHVVIHMVDTGARHVAMLLEPAFGCAASAVPDLLAQVLAQLYAAFPPAADLPAEVS